MLISRVGADFARFYDLVANDIFAFCRALKFEPTWQQAAPLKDVQEASLATVPGAGRYIAVKSGQGPGKTTVAGIIGLWRAFRKYGALTVVTAPTMRQCKEVYIAELRARLKCAYQEVQRFFEVRATELEIMGTPDWGIKTASAAQPENMQGWHNPHLTFIVDEASGIARAIFEMIMGTLTNADKLFLMIGNPNTRDSPFFDCFNRLRRFWIPHTFNAEQSPRVDQANVRMMEDTYGRNSDVYRVRVLGEFPLQDPTCVMSSDDLEACALYPMLEGARASSTKQFGIDLAQFGDDDSVIYRRSGLSIVEKAIFSKTFVDRVIATAFEQQKIAGWRDQDCTYVVDSGGMGDGAIHHFYNAGKRIHPFRFDGTALEGRQYHDKITEAFFGMAALSRTRKIHIPNDPELISELSTRQYALTLTGRLKIESKREYKKRVQNGSPDRADAAVMAFYDLSKLNVRVAVSDN